jgi:hypothetical protein
MRELERGKLEKIESIGAVLGWVSQLAAPLAILLIAVALWIYRLVRRARSVRTMRELAGYAEEPPAAPPQRARVALDNARLAALGAVAAAAVVLAVVLAYVTAGPAAAPEETYLIQGLDPGKIATIVIGRGEDEVTLKRADGRFVVASKADYPAQTKKINSLLKACLDVQGVGRVTGSAENHADLGVTEEKASTLVKLLDGEGKLLTGLAVGASAAGGRGTYVRELTSDDVYLAKDMPFFDQRAMDYVDQQLLKLERDDIDTVTCTGPKGTFTLEVWQEGPKLVLRDMPAGRKLKESTADWLVRRLEDLSFDDVMKRSSEQAAGLEFDRTIVCRLKDETVYTVELAERDGKHYAVARAEFTGELPRTITEG